MGKDQELLEAARCGNYAVVERILNQRAKKTGPLASLRRGPGPNIQDNNGYTPLHHASLNGHKDIVAVLLNHDASANSVDHKGCTPLHLAAWSGNTEIVKTLLTHGPSFPSVNQMNFDHESALHSAAQYGHTEIVKLLLDNNCYNSVRNVRNESPLDLASQYGRLETVQCLLNSNPNLLSDIVRCHSPLHLAAKNGHKHVVKLLLDSGFDINYMTDIGTSLHEAAMYGKLEVVKLLLDYGIDPTLENSRKRTVFDILDDLNTCIAKQIEEVIRDHMTLIKLEVGSTESLSSIMPPQGFVVESHFDTLLPEKCSLSEITPPRQFCSPALDDSIYDIPPPPKLVNESSPRANDSLSSLTASQSQDSCFDQTSCSSCSPSKCDPSESSVFQSNIYQNVDSDSLLYEIPPPPSFFASKRFSDPLQQCSTYQNVSLSDTSEEKEIIILLLNCRCQWYQHKTEDISFDSKLSTSWTHQNSYIPMLPSNSCNNRPQPPAKPPRKSISPHSSEFRSVGSQRNSYEFLCLATSGLHECPLKFLDRNKNTRDQTNYVKKYFQSDYVEMSSKNRSMPAYENHAIICANGLDVDRGSYSADFEPTHFSPSAKFSDNLPFALFFDDVHRKVGSFNNLMPSKSTPALHASRHTLDQVIPYKELQTPKPNYLNLKKKRASVQIPTSPTNYQQPPTPDNPPPSPGTAEIGIHEKIHPSGQAVKKKLPSRDIDTLTDEQLVATIGPHGEIELTLATDNKCVSTENENTSKNPFAGLHHGSVSSTVQNENPLPLVAKLRKTENKHSSCKAKNIYENVQITMEQDKSKVLLPSSECGDIQSSNSSCLSVMSPFDESAEWDEIAGIMASFGGSISRETVFVRDVEPHFAQAFKSGTEAPQNSYCFNSVEQWLSYIGLPQYDNILIINGFDDINFMGGKMLDDIDLQEIGIHNAADRQKLIMSSQHLPSVEPLGKMKNSESFPDSVDEWLHSLNLIEYSENFANNNITDMHRALKLWEVELNTVLKISKLGHRKRILASLGDKHIDNFVDSKELDLSKLAVDLSELEVSDNLNKQYCVIKAATKNAFDGAISELSDQSYLRIRSPTQLMSDSRDQSSVETQWRHHPDELVINSCNYMAKYLGSTLVKELQGLASTITSIQKLKSSTKDIAKIPNIILSISYSGVKFIDAETQQLVCEHEIRNIHRACQDAEDLRHFAYITKEHQTHHHYCHVFSSHSADLAAEIILTLGQAFEVAYQMAMREKAGRSWNNDPRNNISSKNISSS